MNEQGLTEFVILWNTGAGLAYIYAFMVALASCIQIQGGFQTSLIADEASFGKECAVAILGLIFSFIVVILNIQHTRRYFTEKDTRTPVDFAATIGLIVLICLSLTRTVSAIASFGNVSTEVYKNVGGAMNLTVWAPLFFDAFCLITAGLGLMFLARKPAYEEHYVVRETNSNFDSGGIGAEVATHAMGHPAPTNEMREEAHHTPSQDMNDPLDEDKRKAEAKKKAEAEAEAKKKKVPPVLSVNPDNDMLGKINFGKREITKDAPTFANPDDGQKVYAKLQAEEAKMEKRTKEEDMRQREQGHAEREEVKKDIEESIMELDEIDIVPVDSLPVDKDDD